MILVTTRHPLKHGRIWALSPHMACFDSQPPYCHDNRTNLEVDLTVTRALDGAETSHCHTVFTSIHTVQDLALEEKKIPQSLMI